MSDFKLTLSQQKFVDSDKKNTLVSASAGSGKTSTMIAKLTDMIVNHKVPISKLLVVTYTNSAGSEMKQKLFNSLIKALQNEEDEQSSGSDSGTCHGRFHGCLRKLQRSR